MECILQSQVRNINGSLMLFYDYEFALPACLEPRTPQNPQLSLAHVHSAVYRSIRGTAYSDIFNDENFRIIPATPCPPWLSLWIQNWLVCGGDWKCISESCCSQPEFGHWSGYLANRRTLIVLGFLFEPS